MYLKQVIPCKPCIEEATHELVPDEDIYQDGELDETFTRMVHITPVQEHIINMISLGKWIVVRELEYE